LVEDFLVTTKIAGGSEPPVRRRAIEQEAPERCKKLK
jgi:hypothetical protein